MSQLAGSPAHTLASYLLVLLLMYFVYDIINKKIKIDKST